MAHQSKVRRARRAGCCHYCGESDRLLLTADHLTPLSRGGSWDDANLVCCCVRCNATRAASSMRLC